MRRRFVGLAMVMGALAILVSCSDDGSPGAAATSPIPTPSPTAFEETEWTITPPAGWSRADATSTVDAAKAIRYTDARGNYFIVAIDPSGSDFSADAIWRYAAKGSTFEVVMKTPCTGGAEAQCSTSDNRYDVYLMWDTTGDPPKVGGHTWYFIFGNTTSTTIDETVFERIVESIKVKG